MYSLEDTWDLNHTFLASETNLMTLRSLTDDAPNMLRTSFRSFAFYRELDEQVLWRKKNLNRDFQVCNPSKNAFGIPDLSV